jgi:hypothetical protein
MQFYRRLSSTLAALVIFAGLTLLHSPGSAAEPDRSCTTLTCAKCEQVCKATCDADAKVCAESGSRRCPGRYRACTRGCTFDLCAQCMPVQYGAGGKKFLPGKTELCRSPGRESN